MRNQISRKASQRASALLTVLIIGTMLAMSVAFYLSFVEQQGMLSTRSQYWNVAMTVAEAGVEEGLEELNTNPNNPGADGWTQVSGTPNYTVSRTLADGNSYTITLYLTNSSNPAVIAQANIGLPAFAVAAQGPIFAAAGVTPNATVVKRAVQVTCSKPSLFTAAVVVKNDIDLKGNGVYSDSFDSTSTNKSTNGQYDSTKYSGDKGDMMTVGGITDSVSVQNGNIYGKVHTGPGCPVSIGPQGGVGPHASQTSDINTAIKNGYVVQDANFTFPDTTLPNTTGYATPPSGNVVTSSNYVSSASTNSSNYPSPPPFGGATTNTTYTTNSSIPSPKPPGLTTNSPQVTTSIYPGPKPGMTTNTVPLSNQSSPPPAGAFNITTNTQTSPTTTSSYPAPGTYTGTITTNWNGGHNHITGYTYNQITGYTYNYSTWSYTYTSYSYSYPNYTYTYSLYNTNTYYFTNAYDNIMYGGNNYVANALSGQTIVLKNPNNGSANVTLVMPNGMTGVETITMGQGANILIYSGGTSFSAAGNQIINPYGNAASFIVYCAPSVTSFSLAGNGAFTGVLVAPNAAVALKGGGNNNQDFSGSLIANSITLNGHFSFHYDESLSSASSNGRYLVTSWNEVTPQ
jgi:hypothetical protein